MRSMEKSAANIVIDIAENQVVTFYDYLIRVECLTGTIWITRPNGQDVILTAGNVTHVASRGKICVSSLNSAATIRMHTVKSSPKAFLKRLLHRRRYHIIDMEPNPARL